MTRLRRPYSTASPGRYSAVAAASAAVSVVAWSITPPSMTSIAPHPRSLSKIDFIDDSTRAPCSGSGGAAASSSGGAGAGASGAASSARASSS